MKLTRAEEDIMQIIWQLGPCTVSQIRDFMEQSLGQPKPPHSSISTIVRILEEKGVLDHKAYGRTYEYFPKISKEDYSRDSLQKLVTDYFDGSMKRLVSFLVEEKDLSLRELNDLIDKLEDDRQ
ncbi:MAG TPA: BlaI/MecI/CopY family transcriptional regulator [Flavilitoribacter sp.]|nr:BlaI/MecI/CopY family transcriptional regulator [Flavilitoribacter sp.]HMQ86933.1 BlaI/MecI/CopY family transcriptional regulator [Flavilitoribacter sp.]